MTCSCRSRAADSFTLIKQMQWTISLHLNFASVSAFSRQIKPLCCVGRTNFMLETALPRLRENWLAALPKALPDTFGARITCKI
ncbi:MAG: hypothetical protein AXA67_08360 [Methylothermaceae bacteria B42]|nr:MAG: hypothetical protein AXA67_08360 [Methylothermaceae bacteria B42]